MRDPGLLACADELFDQGSCGSAPHTLFGNFTALPAPNDFHALCSGSDPTCSGTAHHVELTVDAVGNLLLPVDWSGVLVDDAGSRSILGFPGLVPIARTVTASLSAPAFPDSDVPLTIPDDGILGSFTPDGRKLPPIFTPLHDPKATEAGLVKLFGSADAPRTVLRLARRHCVGGEEDGRSCNGLRADECTGGSCEPPRRCSGGPQQDVACDSDADCPGSVCGGGLFDFTTRAPKNGGPIVLGDCQTAESGCLTAQALDPVPLDGIIETAKCSRSSRRSRSTITIGTAMAMPPTTS